MLGRDPSAGLNTPQAHSAQFLLLLLLLKEEQHQSVVREEKNFFFFLPSHCSPLSLCTTHSDLKPIGQRRFFLEAKGRIWGQIRPLSLRST